MGNDLLIAAVLVFFAAFVAVETALNWWLSTRGSSARRLQRRLAMIGAAPDAQRYASLLKRRLRPFDADVALGARWRARVDALLVQSGSNWDPRRLLMRIALGMALGTVLAIALRASWVATGLLVATGGLGPWVVLLVRRADRRRRFEALLPDALDLIGRALRSGHSFPSALQLAGQELSDPIGEELRTTSDEIVFGSPVPAALEHLARRVPSQDLSFFVIAVTIQRETGGNLAEVLDNIARIIRERLRLFGKVRAISAEARISAWVLALLPVVTALLLYSINPTFVSQLWTEPAGVRMIQFGVLSTVVGIVWMRRIIRIHV